MHCSAVQYSAVLSKLCPPQMERILAQLTSLAADLGPDQKLEIVFDGRTEHLTFYRVGAGGGQPESAEPAADK